VVTIGVSQVLYNLILNNPEHFPTSGLFFIYVLVTVQLLPILLIIGMDGVLFGLFGESWISRGWRTLLYTCLLLSVVRQAELLSLEPVRTWLLFLAATHLVVLVVLGVTLLAALWYVYRLLNSYIVLLSPLALVLTVIFVYQAGLLGAAWHNDVAPPLVKAGTTASVDPPELPAIFIIMWDVLV